MSLNNRYEFVLLFDVADGNPNGDPDADNMPRVDPETGHGLITDVCLKRKIRDFVAMVKEGQPGYDIYVRSGEALNSHHEKAYKALKLEAEDRKKPKEEHLKKLTAWMSEQFFDIRTFGAVMTTSVNTGQVRGPVQMKFARSIDPVEVNEHSITRQAVTREGEDKRNEMGRKYTVPYGLYRCHGYVSAPLAQKSGFSEEDLMLVWQALTNMFDHDRSASRGEMSACALYVFKHDSELGNAPAKKLFDAVKVERISEGPARKYSDYAVSINEDAIPDGVQIISYLD